jgi:glucosyl-dolichyl phosphate glucuronosyltransferase
MNVSIVIVTRDRAEDLKPTLESMRQVRLPDGLGVELLVIDNGSRDHTRQVVESFRQPGMEVRHVLEERPGLSRGRNRAVEEAKGGILLCTDDDIRPPESWLVDMIDPLVTGRAEAVSGGVRLAPGLLRPWMTPMHRSWLASTEWLGAGELRNVVGANMGFSRAVFDKIRGFDNELGAGALGCFEEVLFSSQLIEAGFRIFNRLDVCVEHHFQESRLRRESWLDAARKMGTSQAYVGHHWHHWSCRFGALRLMRASLRLKGWRRAFPERVTAEGCDEQELKLVLGEALVRAHIKESKTPRKYHKHGLVKLTQAS